MSTARPPDSTAPVNDHPACRSMWPAEGLYAFAGRVEAIVIVGLAGDDEVRIVDDDGVFRTVPQHRVTLVRPRDLS